MYTSIHYTVTVIHTRLFFVLITSTVCLRMLFRVYIMQHFSNLLVLLLVLCVYVYTSIRLVSSKPASASSALVRASVAVPAAAPASSSKAADSVI
jgi:hypothetical protein